MSRTHELTAFRASGFSLATILAPLLLSAFFLCGLNFYVCSEVTTKCRQKAREMLFEETTINPLVLLQRQKLLRIKESYIDMKLDSDGTSAKDVLLITGSQSRDRLSLMSAKKFSLDHETLVGNNVALISHLPSTENQFDTLILENQKSLWTDAPSISQFMKQNRTRLNAASLPLKILLLRADQKTGGGAWRKFQYVCPEVLRRLSLGLAAISFTFMGSVLGMEVGRSRSHKGVIWASLLAIFVFASYMLGKQMKAQFLIPCLAFTLPHFILLFISLRLMKRITRGVE
jgi:lipopolysaccharide export system permease protein